MVKGNTFQVSPQRVDMDFQPKTFAPNTIEHILDVKERRRLSQKLIKHKIFVDFSTLLNNGVWNYHTRLTNVRDSNGSHMSGGFICSFFDLCSPILSRLVNKKRLTTRRGINRWTCSFYRQLKSPLCKEEG